MTGSDRWFRRALVFVLVAMVTLSPGAGAKDGENDKKADEGPLSQPADQMTKGWILAPTHDATRLFSPMSTRGVTHYLVEATEGADFVVQSTDSSHIRSCSLSVCFQTGDFDVVFFHDNGDGSTTVTGRFTEVGAEDGEVPPNTSFGHVYMKTPGMDPKAKGFEFVYAEISS